MRLRLFVTWFPGIGGRAGSASANRADPPLLSLHRNVNRLFDDGSPGSICRRAASAASWHGLELGETDTEVGVMAELADMDEEDVDITIEEGVRASRREETRG
jgi:HSP20 family protein